MHPKVEDSPTTLTGRNIASIEVQFHLVFTVAKLHCCTVMTLVDIFVDVFDSFDGGNALDIDMTAIFPN
jgi:hypothetical protein